MFVRKPIFSGHKLKAAAVKNIANSSMIFDHNHHGRLSQTETQQKRAWIN